MKLEEEKEERQAEFKRRVYCEHVQKFEEERRERSAMGVETSAG